MAAKEAQIEIGCGRKDEREWEAEDGESDSSLSLSLISPLTSGGGLEGAWHTCCDIHLAAGDLVM